MSFLLNDDLKEFQESLRAFFQAQCTSSDVRRCLLGEGRDNSSQRAEFTKKLWPQLAELGVFSAPIPDTLDGLGFGVLAAAVILSEGARVLAPVPLFETMALGLIPLVTLAPVEPLARGIVDGTASGGKILSGVFPNEFFRAASSAGTLIGRISGPRTVEVSGAVECAPALLECDTVLMVVSLGQEQLALVAVERAALGQIQPLVTFDLVRSFGHLRLERVSAQLLAEFTMSDERWLWVCNTISTLAAAEIVGAAQRVEELTVEHVKTRKQFNQPIGSFQAVQHKLSDIHVAIEGAESLLRFAAWSADNDHAQFSGASAAVKGFCGENLSQAMEGALQLHGGIGFTYEYDLHLFLRRAQMMAANYGTTSESYRKIGAMRVAGQS